MVQRILLFGFLGCLLLNVPLYADQKQELFFPEFRPLGEDFQVYHPQRKGEEVQSPKGVLSLQQAIALTLAHNSELRSAAWEVKSAQGLSEQAGAWINPELGAGVESLDNQWTLEYSQTIELGGKRGYRSEIAARTGELAGWEYESKRLDLITETTKSYTSLWIAQRRFELLTDMERISRGVFDAVTERVRLGKDAPLIQTQARIEWMNSGIQLSKALRDVKLERNRLVLLWNSRNSEFEKVSPVQFVPLPAPSLEDLTPKLKQNPILARWPVAEARLTAELELANSQNVPDLTLSGGIQYLTTTKEQGFVAGISIPLPVFNRNSGEIASIEARLYSLQQKQKASENQLTVKLEGALQHLATAYREIDTLQSSMLPDSQGLLGASQEGYLAGKLNYLEMLHAQRTLLEIEMQVLASQEGYIYAKADVERLIAESLPELPLTSQKGE